MQQQRYVAFVGGMKEVNRQVHEDLLCMGGKGDRSSYTNLKWTVEHLNCSFPSAKLQ
jgi:hypothetical protein